MNQSQLWEQSKSAEFLSIRMVGIYKRGCSANKINALQFYLVFSGENLTATVEECSSRIWELKQPDCNQSLT